MKKLLKIAAVLVGVVIALAFSASVALRFLLPPEKAKALVLKQLSAQLKREVQLGSASVGVLSGLSLSDLKISESPDFSKGTFLSSEKFYVRVSLFPLLFRRIIIRHLALHRPTVTIIRYRDGKTYNFSDLTSTAGVRPPEGGQTPAAAQVPAPSFLFLVTRAEIRKGTIHFIDQSPAQASAEISALNLKLKNVNLTTSFGIQCSLKALIRGTAADVQWTGQIDPLKRTLKTIGRLDSRHLRHENYEGHNFELKWNLADVTPELTRASGTVTLRQGAGLLKIPNNGSFQAVWVPALANLSFDSVRGEGLVKNGTLNIQTFELTGSGVNLEAQGTFGLTGALPMDIQVSMKRPLGLKFFIQGPAANPRVKVDLRTVSRQTLEQVSRELLKGKSGEDLQKALKNLFR